MTKLCVLMLLVTGCVIESSDDTGPTPFCGDGVTDSGEQCDDGNNINGDGCSAACVTELPPQAHITANWQLKNVAGAVTACPQGFDTAAVYSQKIDSAGNNVGSPNIDLFDCSANTGTVDVDPALYSVWFEIANHDNTSVYAKSLSAAVDVTTADKTFSAQILNDGGYFQLQWTLRGATSNNVLTCAQAMAAGGVEAASTDVSNSQNSASDVFDCTDNYGITAGFLAATYTVSVAALNNSNQSIGTAPALTNKVIGPKNAVTNLGSVTIPITGL
jgi:cysteine-rich repeat protein